MQLKRAQSNKLTKGFEIDLHPSVGELTPKLGMLLTDQVWKGQLNR